MTKQYLIDSNVLMEFFKKRGSAADLMNALRQRGTLAMSALSIMELQAGWTDEQAHQFFPLIYAVTDVVDVTRETLQYAGTLRRDYRKHGVDLPSIDTIIAATAIQNNMCMVTYNLRDFEPIKELELYPM